jgi:hypothetical protein
LPQIAIGMKIMFRWLLIMVPIAIIAFQLYFSNFSNLTRWKGGGFGMYTDIHINHRSIWLKVELPDTTTYLKIQPVAKSWAPDDKQVAEIRQVLTTQLDRLLSFPASVNYSHESFKQVKAILNQPEAKKVTIIIGQMTLDIDKESMQNKVLYSHDI